MPAVVTANVSSGTVSNPQKVLLGLQAQIYRETVRASRPLPHLMAWLLDRRNLEAAWNRVRSTDGASTPGGDGVTCASIQPRLADWLSKLTEDLYHGTYQPSLPRWVDVPKSRPGTFRRLGILTVRDRVVHAALKQVLEPILEPVFLPNSFGFRPGRSVAGALAEAVRHLDGSILRPVSYTVGFAVDVATCFDTIDHEVLQESLRAQVGDAELLGLLGKLLEAGGTRTRRWWWNRRHGLVQGSALSPLLCNYYLHPVDQHLVNLGQHYSERIQALRYADNLLLLASNGRMAGLALHEVKKQLRLLRQQLGEGQPRLCPLKQGIDWLGVRLRARSFPVEDRTSYGYVIPDAKVLNMLARVEEMTTAPSAKIGADVFNLERWIVAINRQLREWRQAYLFADNAAEVFRTLDDHVSLRFGRLLCRITGDRFQRVRKQYRVRLPRGFWTWQVNGVRMSVLSSLAPHHPANLTRVPEWMRVRGRVVEDVVVAEESMEEETEEAGAGLAAGVRKPSAEESEQDTGE
jgi:group II intron reverse transcriptase/maturase